MYKSKVKGFNLIELMVVVVIVGILAGIGIPAYTDHVTKTRRTDARIALTEAANYQERIFTETRSYLPNNKLSQLVSHSDGKSSPEGYYTLSVSNPDCTYKVGNVTRYECFTITATATGSQAGDSDCATLTLNHLGQKDSTNSAGKNEAARGYSCWK